MSISPTESQVLAAFRTALLAALPTGVGVYLAQGNRVPEPEEVDFVIVTPLQRQRIETNVDDYIDCLYTGAVSSTTLTVSAVNYGVIAPGNPVFGAADGTTIVNQLTGTPGGVGTYSVSVAQTLASGLLASGTAALTQNVDVTFQLDVHGPGSGDNAQALSTFLRDDAACQLMEQSGLPIDPLYADDPKQVPFIDAENQYEFRWIIEAHLQVNQTLSIGQQFADAVTVGLINVDAVYPP